MTPQKQTPWKEPSPNAKGIGARHCEYCGSLKPGMQPLRLNGKRGYWHLRCFDKAKAASWTKEEWEAWRAENRRLIDEGWKLSARFMLNGDVEEYAEKDGVEIRRDPKWIENSKGPETMQTKMMTPELERFVGGILASRDLLTRCLMLADSGHWRDRTGLNLSAHPLWDDVREALNSEHR